MDCEVEKKLGVLTKTQLSFLSTQYKQRLNLMLLK